MISFLPALLVVVLAEIFAWRSLFVYLAAGGLIGILGKQTTIAWGGLDFANDLFTLCLAGGFAGGFVYWLIAGRDAGRRTISSA